MAGRILTDELAELTGEELYYLLTALIEAEGISGTVLGKAVREGADIAGPLGLMEWMTEARIDALSQLGRITVPIREAQQIIYRAVYARNHPVRVAGT